MLAILIERLLICLTNTFTHRMGLRDGGHVQSPQPRAWVARLLGRTPSAPAAAPAPPSDPPVVIGTVIPSAREALRQGNAPPMTVSLTTEMRSKHIYCCGKSGQGKTNFNIGLLDADVAAGRAVVLLDFRGDLVDRLIKRLAARYAPEKMASRLLLVDLRSAPEQDGATADAWTVGFNPLSQCGRTPYARGLFVFDIFQQHFGAALGVQTSETLQNCLLALALTNGNLLDIEPLLTSDTFRTQTLAQIDDSCIHRFFARLEALPDAQRALWVNPIQNKLAAFLVNPQIRAILGSTQSVDIQRFLDDRPDGIVLFCAGADEHYGTTAVMMSNLFVHAVAAAVMRTDRTARHSVLLYADEFQNLCGDKFSEIISEGRRFGLWLTLSHQSPGQLEPKIRTLIRNVVSTSIFFALGGADADMLASEIPGDEPKTVLRTLLINQHPGEAMLLRQGMAAVRIKTPLCPDPDESAGYIRALKQASLRQHGRPLADVEAQLRAREALYWPAIPHKQSMGAAPTQNQTASPKKADQDNSDPGEREASAKPAANASRTRGSRPPSSGKNPTNNRPDKKNHSSDNSMNNFEVREHDA